MLALLYPTCADINCTSFEGADIIVDNTQLIIFGGFAPNSTSADTLSRAMGNRTVQVGTISKSKNDPSKSLQMASRPLMSADELKALPKGTFIVMKTGQHPMKTKLKRFFEWGITFGKPYQAEEHGNRAVAYAAKDELLQAIQTRYPKPKTQNPDSEIPEGAIPVGAEDLVLSPQAAQARQEHPFASAPAAAPTPSTGAGGITWDSSIHSTNKTSRPAR